MYIVVTAEILNFNRSLRFIGPQINPVRLGIKFYRPEGSKKINHSIKGILCNYNEENGDLTNALTGQQVFPVEWTEEFIKQI